MDGGEKFSRRDLLKLGGRLFETAGALWLAEAATRAIGRGVTFGHAVRAVTKMIENPKRVDYFLKRLWSVNEGAIVPIEESIKKSEETVGGIVVRTVEGKGVTARESERRFQIHSVDVSNLIGRVEEEAVLSDGEVGVNVMRIGDRDRLVVGLANDFAPEGFVGGVLLGRDKGTVIAGKNTSEVRQALKETGEFIQTPFAFTLGDRLPQVLELDSYEWLIAGEDSQGKTVIQVTGSESRVPLVTQLAFFSEVFPASEVRRGKVKVALLAKGSSSSLAVRGRTFGAPSGVEREGVARLVFRLR